MSREPGVNINKFILRGHKFGVPQSMAVCTSLEILQAIELSVRANSWKVNDVVTVDFTPVMSSGDVQEFRQKIVLAMIADKLKA